MNWMVLLGLEEIEVWFQSFWSSFRALGLAFSGLLVLLSGDSALIN